MPGAEREEREVAPASPSTAGRADGRGVQVVLQPDRHAEFGGEDPAQVGRLHQAQVDRVRHGAGVGVHHARDADADP